MDWKWRKQQNASQKDDAEKNTGKRELGWRLQLLRGIHRVRIGWFEFALRQGSPERGEGSANQRSSLTSSALGCWLPKQYAKLYFRKRGIQWSIADEGG